MTQQAIDNISDFVDATRPVLQKAFPQLDLDNCQELEDFIMGRYNSNDKRNFHRFFEDAVEILKRPENVKNKLADNKTFLSVSQASYPTMMNKYQAVSAYLVSKDTGKKRSREAGREIDEEVLRRRHRYCPGNSGNTSTIHAGFYIESDGVYCIKCDGRVDNL